MDGIVAQGWERVLFGQNIKIGENNKLNVNIMSDQKKRFEIEISNNPT